MHKADRRTWATGPREALTTSDGRTKFVTALTGDSLISARQAGREPMSSIRRAPRMSLDGSWQFQLLAGVDVEPAPDGWTEVKVPSLWTMDARFGHPHYTNVTMPFDEVYPDVPADNPVGVYRRQFTPPEHGGDRVILHVGAAEGFLAVRVNGTHVGTSTDSHLHAEFDITDALVDGDGELELAVTKWSAESYLEDQDHWWQFGLSRPVSLHVVPAVRLSDVVITADYDAGSERGSVKIDVRTLGLAHLHTVEHTVRVHAVGSAHDVPIGARVIAPTMPLSSSDRSQRPPQVLPEDFMDLLSIQAASAPVPPEFRAIANGMSTAIQGPSTAPGSAVLDLDGLEVAPWTAEIPHLESVRVELIDPAGRVVDAAEYRVGFRRVEIVGRDLLVNRQRVLIQGVNRHDADPRTGRVISRQRMREELSLLKRFNVNAIRTSHYPNDPYLLDLCDEFGFYVVDEADVEGHAFASTIADDPRYLGPIVERVKRMVLRDRNHPSIITWSLGNETGYGAAHDAAAAWVRRVDPTRPVQYEGAVAADWHAGHAASDILCPMYPSFAALEAYARDPRADRPFITCEYAYSQGNSTGGLAHYWELFETLPGLQGGFIWEFTDHALDPDGDGRYRYGGDFGDFPNDGPTLLNGVVFADLTPKPALYEARGIFSPIRLVSDATDALAGLVRVRNRRSFADLSDLVLTARVDTRSGPVALTELTAQITAGSEQSIRLPDEVVRALHDPHALALTITVVLGHDTPWGPAGTELSAHQVVLPRVPALDARATRGGKPALVTEEGALSHPLLMTPPKLLLWRALTDNDASFALDNRFVRSGFFRLVPADVIIATANEAADVEIVYHTAFGDTVVHRSTITALDEGDYLIDEQVALPEGTRDGLRVGVQFTLDEGFASAEWTGLGPWENYPDRKASALLARWSAQVDELATPYIKPQENGTRGGIDELMVTGSAGRVEIASSAPMSATITRHQIGDLERTAHWWELPQSQLTHVVLDIAHRGVGTAMLGADTHPTHRLTGDTYTWQWRLKLTASSKRTRS
ncbi:glycoside hydrolase family 2 [Amycolatopsis balhimycina DSM 5908]|uniref:beta-galactosidase n=1 Tax=Amycolatopsis balhimycina DSM 5908 TaxID=1081091 RepID=A0A428WMB2_AMYBA|nr:glycoside hydrolase family 2 [Amycolatopsis balhimycina DSM 5908]